jgi:hypothetical protein
VELRTHSFSRQGRGVSRGVPWKIAARRAALPGAVQRRE